MSASGLDLVCLVINLDRSPQRLVRLAEGLALAGQPFERISAIDGQALDPHHWAELDRRAYQQHHGKEPTANELACCLSHVAAMRCFLATPNEWALILEDDAQVPANLREVVARVLASGAQGDLNLLFGNRRRACAHPLADLGDGLRVVGYWSKQTGAVAYLINRKAAQALVQGLLPMRLPLDHAFTQVWRWGLRLRGVCPNVVGIRDVPSDIGTTGRKLAQHRRWRTHLARLQAMLCRLHYQLLVDRLWRPARRMPSS